MNWQKDVKWKRFYEKRSNLPILQVFQHNINMKKTLVLLFSFISLTLFGQDINQIDKALNIPDSLSYDAEIRIYKGFGITNVTEIFRMYKKRNQWKIERYFYYAPVQEMQKPNIKKIKLTAKTHPEFVWQSILRANILEIPDMDKIMYKLQKRGEVQLVDGDYEVWNKTSFITDGTGFKVKIKRGKDSNEIYYGNPESYLKMYPEVDELLFFSELLNVIKSEFNMWKFN